ncbi:miller-Dieker lissencephaly protein [Coprinopsis cinerea AmutBmut pab1-1]|nr:miller-Dieker lissencephaly protein [Coprinopsis cinerea AmutBmut pab1-1]
MIGVEVGVDDWSALKATTMTSTTSNYLVAEAQLLAEQARREKAKLLKDAGEPIELPGKALSIEVQGNDVWIAENDHVVKKLNLESGKASQIYRGHTGPVTSIAFYNHDGKQFLISGSWDKSIRVWDTQTKEPLATTTDAHNDFVKTLLVIPTLRLLVSGGSDKIVRFWDLSSPTQPLRGSGSISSHTRPIECLAGYATSATSAVIYTADTMGIIRIWEVKREEGSGSEPPLWRSTQRGELTNHRTRINDLFVGQGLVWTASSDDTAQLSPIVPVGSDVPSSNVKLPKPIEHPTAVRAILPLALTDLSEPYLLTASGDVIRVYDLSTLDEPELISSTDIHWHDVTAIRLWKRKTVKDGLTHVEPWIVTTSLDQTVRKWRLTELLNPPPPKKPEVAEESNTVNDSGLTEEEERELAELLDED